MSSILGRVLLKSAGVFKIWLTADTYVSSRPTSPDWNFKAFVVEFVNEIALMAPRNAEDDGLQLFIFSFAHKLWVKCIEYSSFVFFVLQI